MFEEVKIPVILSVEASVEFAGKQKDIGVTAKQLTAKVSTDVMHNSLYLDIPIQNEEFPEVSMLLGMKELEQIIAEVKANTPQAVCSEEDEKRRNEMWVRTIVNLVKLHSIECNDENCKVSTLGMADLVEHILKRKLTPEEEEVVL